MLWMDIRMLQLLPIFTYVCVVAQKHMSHVLQYNIDLHILVGFEFFSTPFALIFREYILLL